MRLNAAPSSSNSSPVRIAARCSTSPSRTALATSRRCVTGLTITYRTTAHNENIEQKPTTIAATHNPAQAVTRASTVSWSSIVTRTTAIKSPTACVFGNAPNILWQLTHHSPRIHRLIILVNATTILIGVRTAESRRLPGLGQISVRR